MEHLDKVQVLMVKNLEHLQQELKRPVPGNDVELFKNARQHSPMVKNCTVDMISEVLRLCFIKIGLRAANWPVPEEKAVLVNFAYNNFSTHTLDEIGLAFDLAVLGKFECEVNCFENFSCLYFSNIINGYRTWANNQAKQINYEKPKMILNNQITTQAEKLEEIADWEKREHVSMAMIPEYIYDYLLEFNKINPSVTEKNEAMAKAAEYKKETLYNDSLSLRPNDVAAYKEFINQYNNGYTPDEFGRLKQLAKKIIVFDYLNTLNAL